MERALMKFSIDDFNNLYTSTTYYLERISGKKLEVSIIQQREFEEDSINWISREVLLSLSKKESPLLYCTSLILRDGLNDQQYDALINSLEPIGRIFDSVEGRSLVLKRNLEVESITDTTICSLLNCEEEFLFKKQYDYCFKNQTVAFISEYYSQESMDRVFKK
ncbi:hypothetical protein [Sphingobacterium siyangense]|uniref:hypothetical protein n=1 Tax=Sphingobacterium siyangense TaxID=459529 RepID=UPI00289A32C6|nr:hypothetical protein [Sphingobacterium siyangense]